MTRIALLISCSLFLSSFADASLTTPLQKIFGVPCVGNVDLLLWRVRKCHLDYLFPSDVNRYDLPCSSATEGEFQERDLIEGSVVILGKGSAKRVEPDFSAGCRLSLYGECRNFVPGITYTHFSTTDSASCRIASTPYSTSRCHPNLKGYVGGSYLDRGSAYYSLSYDAVDLECGSEWVRGRCRRVKVFAGASIAFIGQEMKSLYWGRSTPIAGSDPEVVQRKHSVVERNDLSSGGLYLGIEGEIALTKRLSLYGNASLGSHVGHFSRSFRENEVTVGSSSSAPCEPYTLVSVNDRHSSVISHLAYAIGLQTDFCLFKRKGGATFGYELHQWNNMLGFMQFVDSREVAAIARAGEPFGFDGLFLRLHLAF